MVQVNGSDGTKMRSGRQLGESLHSVVIAPNKWSDYTSFNDFINGQPSGSTTW